MLIIVSHGIKQGVTNEPTGNLEKSEPQMGRGFTSQIFSSKTRRALLALLENLTPVPILPMNFAPGSPRMHVPQLYIAFVM